MIKKILTITAAALVTTGAWADVRVNGITYFTSSSITNNGTTEGPVSTITNYVVGSENSPIITITATKKTTISDRETTTILTPKSFTGTVIDFTGESEKLTSPDPTETSYDIKVSSFSTYSADNYAYENIIKNEDYNKYVETILTIKSRIDDPTAATKTLVLKGDAIKEYPVDSKNVFVCMDGAELLEEQDYYDYQGNDINNDLYYIVTSTTSRSKKTTNTAKLIGGVKGTVTESTTYSNCTEVRKVTTIPSNFLTAEVTSLTIPTSVTTIDTQAFANVSENLAGITANGSFKVVGDALYNVAGTRLVYVMQSAVNNGIFTVPAAVTSIDPYAFKNVENSTIFLNNKVTSYTGTSGNGNTFIGNTLNSGSITDNMLTSGAYEVPNNITTIKEGAFCSTLTSVTIPSTVTKIEAGAFKNCTNLQVITLRSGSTYKLIDNMLINQNHNIIVVTKNVPKNISFQDYVSQVGAYISKVYDYAFKNVTGVTVSSNKDFNVDETKQGTGNTFIMPDVDLHREANVITGNVTRENFSKLAFNAGWCYDLRDAKILEPLDADFFAEHVPHNCLLFFGEVNNSGNMVAGDNIVWAEKTTGGKTVYRSNHVIMYDDAPYHNDIAEVECVQADMYRTYKSRQWATIYVPIDFTGITSNTWVGDFDKYDPTTKSLHFKVVENVTHNRPYVLFNNLEIDVPVLGKPNVTLFMSTEDAQPVTWNNMVFTGDYDEWKVTTQTNIYGYTSSGKFAHATTGATFKPFRAWFVDNNTYSNGNELHAIFEDEEGNEINLGSASGIEEIDEPEFEGGIYNLNGTKVNDMKNPGLYIQNGKIIIIK